MKYDPQKHHRRSIRLKGYDYAQPGAYFITIVTHDRECLFGEIVDGEMRLNEFGEIARAEWFQTAVVRPNVVLHPDEFVVMPNHIHGIIWIVDNDETDMVGATRRVAPTTAAHPPAAHPSIDPPTASHSPIVGATRRVAPTTVAQLPDSTPPMTPTIHPRGPVTGSIGAIIGQFKSIATKRINDLRRTPGAPVWQRNYYEHIIRNERALNAIQRYILNNPANWKEDAEYVEVTP